MNFTIQWVFSKTFNVLALHGILKLRFEPTIYLILLNKISYSQFLVIYFKAEYKSSEGITLIISIHRESDYCIRAQTPG